VNGERIYVAYHTADRKVKANSTARIGCVCGWPSLDERTRLDNNVMSEDFQPGPPFSAS